MCTGFTYSKFNLGKALTRFKLTGEIYKHIPEEHCRKFLIRKKRIFLYTAFVKIGHILKTFSPV